MTTVPGTYFTKEQLEAALTADNISAENRTAAMENNSIAQSNIGTLYYNGHGVPNNYLCALKWLLKATQGFSWLATCNHIGKLFEYGLSVPLDKYRALEWYCRTFESQAKQLQSLQKENQELQLKTNNLEQQVREKDSKINVLENEKHGHQQGANEMVSTLKSLLQAKNSEIELNNLKMEHALNKEKGMNKKMLKEIKRLKQQQQQQQQTLSSREASPSSNTAVLESTLSNTRINGDDPNNDINYDNTSDEDGDNANDLNYDSDG